MTLQRQAKHQTSESSRKPQLFLFLILEYIFLCGVTCIFLQGHNHHLRSTLSKVLRHSLSSQLRPTTRSVTQLMVPWLFPYISSNDFEIFEVQRPNVALQSKLPLIISKLINKDSSGGTRALPGSNQSSVAGAILSL